ncbi:DUF1763-domain-containing protein [Xylariomycetidae sp. FL0641]|nr:DUF1763-domain-containing protein [Xylariomycetidae sp. FL0641]
MASHEEIIHAYRSLYRNALNAVKFSKKARFIVRDQLRTAFREKGAQYNRRGVIRTNLFFLAAERQAGLEHRILKSLISTEYFRNYYDRETWRHSSLELANKTRKKKAAELHMEKTRYKHYDMTVAMLNKTTGLCLR